MSDDKSIDVQVAELRIEVEHLTEAVRELKDSTKRLNALVNKGWGALAVVTAIGGLAGWFIKAMSGSPLQ